MRTTVALVQARPETLLDDYRRVLELAGLTALTADEAPALILAGADRFEPGWSATPWQLDGVLAWLGDQTAQVPVLGAGTGGLAPLPAEPLWRECTARYRCPEPEDSFLRDHRPREQQLHPALDAVLPQGVRLPTGLAERPALLLAAPSLVRGWGLRGLTALVHDLVVRGARLPRKVPAAEVTAEAVGVARANLPAVGAVLDGTVWGVASGPMGRGCVARQVLLAGADPVAVDAVAARLAGVEPLRVPWLRACQERGSGRAAPSEIRLQGATELLNLDFGLPAPDFGSPRGSRASAAERALGPALAPLQGLLARLKPSQTAADYGESPWSRLEKDYAAGQSRTWAGD